MRILFVTPYAPSLIRVRPYQLMGGLVRRGHQIALAAVWTAEAERSALQALAARNVQVRCRRMSTWRSVWNCLGAAGTGEPFQSVYSWHPGLQRDILRAVREFRPDVIHVEHLRGARYGINLPPVAERRIPAIWDSVDCISLLFRQARIQSRSARGRWMTRVELPRTEAYEGWLASQFDRVLVTSPVDGRALEDVAKARGESARGKLRVLRNGVDLEYFSPGGGSRDPATLVLTGKMSYHANVTAALHLVEDIMPAVWAARPDASVLIAGKDPPSEVRALQHRAANPNPNGNPSVVVTGTVSDIRPFLRRATLAAAPLVYGVGIQNKVLEAMACGTPVVASAQAASALAAKPDRDLLIGAEAGAFAHRILDLLGSPGLRDAVGRAGRQYVETHHNWDGVAVSLESIYREAIDSLAVRHASA